MNIENKKYNNKYKRMMIINDYKMNMIIMHKQEGEIVNNNHLSIYLIHQLKKDVNKIIMMMMMKINNFNIINLIY